MNSRILSRRQFEEFIPAEPVRSQHETMGYLKFLMRQHGEGSVVHKRISAILLWLEGDLDVAAVAAQVGVSVASVYVYKKAYKTRGITGLTGRGPGRPQKTNSMPLELVIMHGLRRMRCFHLPTLRDWVKQYDAVSPDWTLRRLARRVISVNRFKFTQMRRPQSPRPPYIETSRTRLTDAAGASIPEGQSCDGQSLLNLDIVESPGLKAWFDLPPDDFLEWIPYMRQGRPSSFSRSSVPVPISASVNKVPGQTFLNLLENVATTNVPRHLSIQTLTDDVSRFHRSIVWLRSPS